MIVKKILIILLVLLFAGAVLSRNAFAAEMRQDESVSYKLPYPGTLPDSPLYVIKNLRDQVVGLFIVGPVNKSFYNLFLADKRAWAGQILVESGNPKLGAVTLLIAEEYSSRALDQALEAKKAELVVSDLGAKLLVSSSKHAEILENAAKKVSGDDAINIGKALALNAKLRARALELTMSR